MQPNLLNVTLHAILELLDTFFVCTYHCKNSFRIKTTAGPAYVRQENSNMAT